MQSLSSEVSIHVALWGDSAHQEVSDFQAQEPQHVGGLLQKGEVQCLDFSHVEKLTQQNSGSRVVTHSFFIYQRGFHLP